MEFHGRSSFHPGKDGMYTTTVVTSPKKVYGILGSLAGGGNYFKSLKLMQYLNTNISFNLAWQRLSLANISNEIQKTTDWKKPEGSGT